MNLHKHAILSFMFNYIIQYLCKSNQFLQHSLDLKKKNLIKGPKTNLKETTYVYLVIYIIGNFFQNVIPRNYSLISLVISVVESMVTDTNVALSKKVCFWLLYCLV